MLFSVTAMYLYCCRPVLLICSPSSSIATYINIHIRVDRTTNAKRTKIEENEIQQK